MTQEKELRTIKYVFTSDQTKKNAAELAEACRIKQATEDEKKSVMSNLKAKIDSQESRIGLLSSYITTGYDWRTVECVVRKNTKTKTVEYYYGDELVDSRPFNNADAQLTLSEE